MILTSGLNTKEDRLSFLQDWLRQYDSAHAVHYFTETRLGIAVGADDRVRRAHTAHRRAYTRRPSYTHTHNYTPSTRPCRESGPWHRGYLLTGTRATHQVASRMAKDVAVFSIEEDCIQLGEPPSPENNTVCSPRSRHPRP